MKNFSVFYFISYVILISAALGIFYIFKPYTYIDNAASTVACKNGNQYEIGWNFIYTFNDKLDDFNDVKARKVCEYGAIKDYGNTLKAPEAINYKLQPVYIQESSWADAIFMFFVTLIFGAITTETFRSIYFIHIKKAKPPESPNKLYLKIYLALLLFLVPTIFFVIIKKPAQVVFCKRQVARKVNNFKRVIFKYGIVPIPEEDKHIKSILNPLYESCLMRERQSLF